MVVSPVVMEPAMVAIANAMPDGRVAALACQATQALHACPREKHLSSAESSGVWGAFAKLAEKGAEMFGAKAAIDVLEEGDAYAARS